MLPSLREIVVEEFSIRIARILAPSLRSVIFGTDFGGDRRNSGWNASPYGDAGQQLRDSMGRIMWRFLEEHALSLQSIKLHYALPGIAPRPTEFPQLRTLAIPPFWLIGMQISAPHLQTLHLSYASGLDHVGDNLAGLSSAKAITLYAPQTKWLSHGLLSTSTESITIMAHPHDWVACSEDIRTFLGALGNTPAVMFPSLKHLSFKFEGESPFVGIRNWGHYLSSLGDDASESSYAPSESGDASDNAEYYEDSDEWESTEGEEEKEEEGTQAAEVGDGEMADVEADGDPIVIDVEDLQDVSTIDAQARGPNPPGRDTEAQIDDEAASTSDSSISDNSGQPPQDFSMAYLQLLNALAWVKSVREKAGEAFTLETVTIVEGKRCEEDLSIPKLLEGGIMLCREGR